MSLFNYRLIMNIVSKKPNSIDFFGKINYDNTFIKNNSSDKSDNCQQFNAHIAKRAAEYNYDKTLKEYGFTKEQIEEILNS